MTNILLHMSCSWSSKLSHPPEALENLAQQLNIDINCILAICQTRYLQGRSPVLKSGTLHLAWEYAQSPSDHHRFINMLCVSPEVFQVILSLIEDHPVFSNNSNHPQELVKVQLGVTLYRMGRYGNGASLEDIAHVAGCSEGAVELYTQRCFRAMDAVHNAFVCLPTAVEKEWEKCWIDERLGFRGTWQEGWVMYNGTIVPLYAKPAVNGEAYFTCKSNYGLNLQVCNTFLYEIDLKLLQVGNLPSNPRIVDYSLLKDLLCHYHSLGLLLVSLFVRRVSLRKHGGFFIRSRTLFTSVFQTRH